MDVTNIVGFYRPASEITEHTATIDLCDTDDCNIGYSLAGMLQDIYVDPRRRGGGVGVVVATPGIFLI